MASLNLQRSKQKLEDEGWFVWIVEVWLAWGHVRRDMFNMMDLAAIKSDVKGVTGVQCCGEDVQEHIRKLLEGYTDSKGKAISANIYLKPWLEAGNTFFIWAWRKRGESGKRKVWTLRQIEFRITNGIVTPYEIPTND